jgi:hypothetical protein
VNRLVQRLDDMLVDGWRRSWRWFSLQMHLIACALLAIVEAAPVLPPDVQKLIPQPWAGIVLAAWAIIGIIGRLKKQKSSAC